MTLNLNVGILGHVDSGKTSLARAVSAIASTAAFDKNPQSQERGITLDLGFSAVQLELPAHLRPHTEPECAAIRYTFVDCPGHASLIRTIIGGAQIIDLMVLVIDAGKGIQTQTAECLVIGELTCERMIVAVNKVDTLPDDGQREKVVDKLRKRITGVLEQTVFRGSPIVPVSATGGINLDGFLATLQERAFVPQRNAGLPFVFAVDHCFAIKGQGTVCTGTVLQGSVKVNDEVDIPKLRLQRKVKSIQMFRNSYQSIRQGDRAGLCITQFDPKALERGIVCAVGHTSVVYAAIVRLTPIKHFKGPIKTKAKFHITCGYETTMASIVLFQRTATGPDHPFDPHREYEFLEEIDNATLPSDNVYVLLEFEKPLLAVPGALIIGSRLDTDIQANVCRIAFHGRLGFTMTDRNYPETALPQLRIFKRKQKAGNIQRVVNERELIATGLFKKAGNNRQAFVGLTIRLSSGETGLIADTFGASAKVKLCFSEPLGEDTMARLHSKDIQVTLTFKKFLFRKGLNESAVVQ